MEYKLVGSTHPEDLADGRVIGVGETVELSDEDLSDPHNQRLLEEGLLISTEQPKQTSGRKTGEE